MALKFQCLDCGEDIVVRLLHVGEIAKCKSCGNKNIVPENATEHLENSKNKKHKADLGAVSYYKKNSLFQRPKMIEFENCLIIKYTIDIYAVSLALIFSIMGVAGLIINPAEILAESLAKAAFILVIFGIYKVICLPIHLLKPSARNNEPKPKIEPKVSNKGVIFPNKIVFDKTARSIEIYLEEKFILSFDDVVGIRNMNTHSELELSDCKNVVLFHNGKDDSLFRHKVSLFLNKPIVSGEMDSIFQEAQEKMKQRRDGEANSSDSHNTS